MVIFITVLPVGTVTLLRRILNFYRTIHDTNVDHVGDDGRNGGTVQKPKVGNQSKPCGLRTSSWDFARDWRFAQRNNTPCDDYVAHSRSPPDRIPGRLSRADNHGVNRNIDRCSDWPAQSGSRTSRNTVSYCRRNVFSTARVSRRY